ncbi:LysR family transcriptional regulator [Marinivivus vitaminiproducens]|uniref:LysR family transcriptional regulator n=1 Tax=Marinivivus vitaminiproducens TaxID=3035935 RepID=UPI00279C811F|nr:LysR family transcriptional regulator [Geminicoccaceae bacterium SCSIO 64248]
MDTRFLESFVAVVEQGSYADAARRLGMTPAGVAQRIRALEIEIGTTLLARSGRVVRPTEAGSAILGRSRTFLREIRDLRTIATAPTMAGDLRLGAISTALTGLIPALLNRMTARHPRIGIYIEPGTSIELYAKLIGGDLDAALLVEPPFAMPKALAFTPVRTEPLVVIAPGLDRAVDPATLLRTRPFIRYDRRHWGGRLADDYLRTIGIRPQERFELDALEAIAVMVDRGLGVSLVPDWAPPWPGGLSLARLVPQPQPPARTVGILAQAASPRARLIEAFVRAGTDA